MASIEALPMEAICRITDMCIEDHGNAQLALSQTSHHFHDIVNPHIRKQSIFWAAREGRLDTIKKAHAHGVDLSASGTTTLGQKASPLQYAIKHGHRDIVEYLIEVGVDPHVPSKGLCECYEKHEGPYALHTALFHNEVEGAAKLLVQKLGAYWTLRDMPALDEIEDEREKEVNDFLIALPGPGPAVAALRFAIERADTDLAIRILARPDLDASVLDRYGRTPILCAAFRQQVEIAKLLLQRPDVNASIPTGDGFTPLHVAADKRSLPLVELFLQRPEVDAGKADDMGMTALHFATMYGEMAMVQLLLEKPGVNAASADNTGMTPLHWAVKSRDPLLGPWKRRMPGGATVEPTEFHQEKLEVIKFLLARPEVNAGERTLRGLTPLHYACLLGDVKVAKLLLHRHDVDANARALHGQSPLHMAASIWRPSGLKLMGLLLEQPGVEITDVDKDGRTILHYICGNRPKDYPIEILIETALREGVPLDKVSVNGLTAFHQALCSGDLWTAQYLLSIGADPMISTRFKYNNSLLHICLKTMPLADSDDIQIELIEQFILKGIEIDTYTDSPLYNSWSDERDEIENVEGIRSIDILTESDCTPLMLTVCGETHFESMTALLAAGADPNAPVIIRDLELEDPNKSNRQAFLSGVFRHTWDPEGPGDEEIENIRKHLEVLLEHGARLDFDGPRESPLQDACKAAEEGRSLLLEILLDNSTAKNVSKSHVEKVISNYGKKPQHSRIVDLLTKFLRTKFNKQ